MNILTKICVVLLALVSILASVVFSHDAVVKPNWRHEYDKAVSKGKVAEMNSRNNALALHSAQVENRNLITRYEGDMGKVLQDNETLRHDLAALKTTNETLMKANTQHGETGHNLEQSLTALQQRYANVLAQLAEANTKIDLIQQQLTSTENSLADSQAQNQRDVAEKRVLNVLRVQLEEEVKFLEDKLADLGGNMPQAVDAPAEAYVPPVTLMGTVTAVQDDPGLASINIGRVKGVRRGMSMYIYRDLEFVGHLQIEEVDDNEAAGIVVGLRPGMRVLQGDKVTTSLE